MPDPLPSGVYVTAGTPRYVTTSWTQQPLVTYVPTTCTVATGWTNSAVSYTPTLYTGWTSAPLPMRWAPPARVPEPEERFQFHYPQRAADARAQGLWSLVLTPDELAAMANERHPVITGSDGGRYRISSGYEGNVQQLDEHGCVIADWCAHPHTLDHDGLRLPTTDLRVGQVLALKADEAAFLRIANCHFRRPCRRALTTAQVA